MLPKSMRKISRSQLKAWTIGHLKSKQDGKCLLCEKEINLKVMGSKSDYVADHCHITGEIRGVLCRGCNGAEGKVFTAVATWGKQSFNTENVAEFLSRLSKYLLAEGTGIIYPDHKNEEERAVLAKQKANRAAAVRKAKLKLRASE